MNGQTRFLLAALCAALGACTGSNTPQGNDAGVDSRRIVQDVVAEPDVPQCLNPATPAAAYAGCLCQSDCAEPAVCVTEQMTMVPMGECFLQCAQASDCGIGFTCLGSGHCAPTCARPGDCEPGRYCVGSGSGSPVCIALCASDADCESGHCDPWSARCLPTASPQPGAMEAAPCQQGSDCITNICNSSHVCDAPPCVLTHPNCPTGWRCYSPNRNITIEFGYCVVPCGDGGTCFDPAESCMRDYSLGGNYCEH